MNEKNGSEDEGQEVKTSQREAYTWRVHKIVDSRLLFEQGALFEFLEPVRMIVVTDKATHKFLCRYGEIADETQFEIEEFVRQYEAEARPFVLMPTYSGSTSEWTRLYYCSPVPEGDYPF